MGGEQWTSSLPLVWGFLAQHNVLLFVRIVRKQSYTIDGLLFAYVAEPQLGTNIGWHC